MLEYKIILREANEWKEEVIDFQNPYATRTVKRPELAIYPFYIVLLFIYTLCLLIFIYLIPENLRPLLPILCCYIIYNI
jgi:hypothetical protein